jgi:hypothetical protein
MTKKYKYVEQSTYDWTITLKKFFTGLGMTLVPVALLYTITFLQEEEFPEEYAIIIPLIVAILHAIINYLKHWNDTETVKVPV